MVEAEGSVLISRSSLLKSFVAGGFGGLCSVFVGYPLDTIKVRMQTQTILGETRLYTSAVDCLRVTIRNEGIFGLFRGMMAPMIGSSPITATYFYGYEQGKRWQQKRSGDELTLRQIVVAGFVAGLVPILVRVPSDRVKCMMQTQHISSLRYTGSFDCARQLYRSGGMASLYRGLGATLMRDIHSNGVYFGVYECILRTISPGKRREELHPTLIVFAGGTAGISYWLTAIVPDTLKSILQTAPDGKYRGIGDVYRDLMKHEGPKALFKGIGPILLRSFPSNAACLLGYEMALKGMNRIFPSE
ncbi:hypothetical protein EMCRGX_G023686 [Ephydatia muelleri]